MTASQKRGNRGFGASLAEQVLDDDTPEISPADEIMASRSQTISRLASGKVVTDRTEFVDPARCRPWRLHNRDLEKLDEESCRDLIDAFLSAGRQRIPGIVRRIKDDPDFDYEIIAGVRRWWTTKYLREHHHPEFDYLVTVQNMTDEEAFRVADYENRARKDISDMERAKDYLRAVKEFYDGSAKTMADRLNVSESWMARILAVGKLPEEIVSAYASDHDITVRIARDIAPLANNPDTRSKLVEEAKLIASDRAAGTDIPALDVTRRLVAAAKASARRPATKPTTGEFASATGKPMLKFTKAARGGAITVKVVPRSGATRAEMIEAFGKLLDGEG